MVRAIHLRAAVDQEQAGHSGKARSISFAIDDRPVAAARGVLLAVVPRWLVSRRAAVRSAPQYEYEEQLYLRVDGARRSSIDASHARAGRACAAWRSIRRRRRHDRSRRAPPSVRGARAAAWTTSASPGGAGAGGSCRSGCRPPTCGRCPSAGCSPGRRTRSMPIEQGAALSPDGRRRRRRAAIPGAVNWDGSELVAFKLHLPSRIREHNVQAARRTRRHARARQHPHLGTAPRRSPRRQARRHGREDGRRRRSSTRRCGCSAARSWRPSACWRSSSG